MSEQSSEYDPMSLHPGVDEIYTSPEMAEHARLMRSISQEATRMRQQKEAKKQLVVNLPGMKIFNTPEAEDLDKLPVAPPLDPK